jgi:hypothetical protein
LVAFRVGKLALNSIRPKPNSLSMVLAITQNRLGGANEIDQPFRPHE